MPRRFRRNHEAADAGVQSEDTTRMRVVVRRGRLLLFVLLLIVSVAFATNVQFAAVNVLRIQWPLALVIVGAILLLAGLVMARAYAVLLGPVLAGIGLVFVLEPGTAFAGNPGLFGGVIMVGLGLAALLRGLSFARQPQG